MIRAVVFWLFSVLMLRLSARRRVALANDARSSSYPLPPERGHRLSTSVCACLFRETLAAFHVGGWAFERAGLPKGRINAIRAGSVVPSLEEKTLIIDVLHDVQRSRAKSRKPLLRYEDVWGTGATPRNCTCEFRRLLDTHGLTAERVAEYLGVRKTDVVAWRAGRKSPSQDQVSRIRVLAAEQRVVAFRGDQPERMRA